MLTGAWLQAHADLMKLAETMPSFNFMRKLKSRSIENVCIV